MEINSVLQKLNENHSSLTSLVTNIAYFSDEADTYGDFPMGQSVAVQDDGKVIFAGVGSYNSGTSMYDKAIRRYNSDGTEDSTFDPPVFGGGDSGMIKAIAIQNDGKMIVVGHFGSVGSDSVRGIVRLNSDGTLDSSFVVGSGFDNNAFCVYLMSDGKVLVGGNFNQYNGAGVGKLVKLNSDGTLAMDFATSGSVHSVAVDADGKVLAGGRFANNIVRYNTDGTEDSGFNVGSGFANGVGSNPRVSSIQVASDGKIMVGHWFREYNGSPCSPGITRLNSDGTIDSSFATTGSGLVDSNNNGIVQVVRLISSGKMMVGGFFNSYDGVRNGHVVRLNSDGSLDSTFESGRGFNDNTDNWGGARVNDMVVDGDSVFFAGNFSSYDRSARWAYAATDLDGALSSFSVKPPNPTYGIDDGFQDMYDGGNYFNTNLTQLFDSIKEDNVSGNLSIPNTHTPCWQNANLEEDFRDDSSDTYDENGVSYRPVADGEVKDGSSYFGSGSEYFTNMYPGLFVLTATGVDISEFSIAGDLGSDGSSTDVSEIFPLKSASGQSYTAYFKTNYLSSSEGGERGNNDISVNHLIILPGSAVVSVQIDETGEYDDHCISGIDGKSELYVLVFGRWDGNMVPLDEARAVAKKFMEIVSGYVPEQGCYRPCGDSEGFKCIYTQETKTKCRCSKMRMFAAGCTRSQESLGFCSSMSRAYVPAITVCNLRLF